MRRQSQNVLCVGPSGCGKTLAVETALAQIAEECAAAAATAAAAAADDDVAASPASPAAAAAGAVAGWLNPLQPSNHPSLKVVRLNGALQTDNSGALREVRNDVSAWQQYSTDACLVFTLPMLLCALRAPLFWYALLIRINAELHKDAAQLAQACSALTLMPQPRYCHCCILSVVHVQIAAQLAQTSALQSSGSGSDFRYNLSVILENARIEATFGVSLIFVLEEFEAFAKHFDSSGSSSGSGSASVSATATAAGEVGLHRQSMLYALLDLVQDPRLSVAVVALSCRAKVMDSLEKRLRSRFTTAQVSYCCCMSYYCCTSRFAVVLLYCVMLKSWMLLLVALFLIPRDRKLPC
jgi:hypothetical protein